MDVRCHRLKGEIVTMLASFTGAHHAAEFKYGE